MLSINLGRGIFRLWIVASFVWLVSAGALLQEDIRRDVSTLMPVSPLPEGATLIEPPAAKLVVRELRPDVMDAVLFSGLGLSNAEINELRAGTETDKLRASLQRRVTDLLSQRAQGNLMFAASFLLLPPILAFALGWAGLWIVRGFRS